MGNMSLNTADTQLLFRFIDVCIVFLDTFPLKVIKKVACITVSKRFLLDVTPKHVQTTTDFSATSVAFICIQCLLKFKKSTVHSQG